jgi:4-carboxymuconolactone decarboxylase
MTAKRLLILGISLLMSLLTGAARADENGQIVQLAKLEIDPPQLEAYKAALKEGVETALRVEPGVLMLYPMADQENPTHITLLEIYANKEAYEAHLQTPHFLKYKTRTKEMVKSLQLIKTVPLFPALKGKQ